MIERITRASVEHRLAILAVVAVLAIAAAVVGRQLRFDALPDVTGVQVVVLTRAPGLTPEEVERLVTRPVEVGLGGLPGATSQRSLSRYGISAVTVIFDRDFDLVRARQLVSERLPSIASVFPPGVDPPELGPMSGGLGEIFQFVLTSPTRSPAELLELVELRLSPMLRSVGGIVEVNPWGGARRTLDVVGDPFAMARRGVSLAALHEATSRAVGAAPGASLPAGPSHVLLRGRSLPTRPSELAPSLVRTSTGEWVRLSEVARVEEGMIPRIGAGTGNGHGEVVYVMCQMLTGANALEVMADIHAALPTVRRALPPDVTLEVTYDRSQLVEATLHTVGKSLLEGGILVAIVLFAMLGSVRAGSLVASVIPLSMLGAVVWMVAFGVPGNLMSLGALDFGLLVDGAVVVVETTFHALEHRRAHGAELTPESVRETIAQSAAQVATPVFYAVAIIGLVYVPVVSLGGVEGVMFRPMALTVLFALSTALVLSLTFIPAAAATFIRWKDVPAQDPWLPRLASSLYERLLPRTQPRPALLVAFVLAGIASGIVLFRASGTEFIPTLDEGDIVATTSRHPDISLESEIARTSATERAVLEVPEVVGAYHRIGSAAVATDTMGIEQADLFLRMRPRDEWRPGMTHDSVVEALDAAIHAVDPQVALGFTHPIQMRFNELLGGSTSDVSLSIVGDDLVELQRIAQDAAALLATVEGAVDIRVTSPPAVPLLDVVPRPLDAASLGLDATDVLDVVAAQRTGIEAGVTRDGPLRIPVRVRLAGTPSAFDLAQAPVPVGSDVVPLERLATVRSLEAPGLVDHEQGNRRIVIAFNVRGRDLGSVVAEAQARFDREITMPDGYLPRWGGQYENLEAAQGRLLLVLPVVLFGVLLLLRQALGRWRSAVLVFGNVPFAAVGGITLLWLRQMPISISAAIGFIALSGIAVMNGVVLVSRIHAEEEAGHAPADAALLAAKSRLRPVLMTALVAGLGFVPMMLAHGVGAEVQAPLATVVVGGLFTSTVLTLVVLPAIYARIAGSPPPKAPPTDRGVELGADHA